MYRYTICRRRYNGCMAWENVQERLKNCLQVKIDIAAGSVWLPEIQMDVDEWLYTLAETDHELQELDSPRVLFLQHRWPFERLLELEWDNQFSSRCTFWAMYVGRRAYIFITHGMHYQVVGAVEPKNEPTVYRALIGELLRNPKFVREYPTSVRNYRPDLIPDIRVGDLGHGKLPPGFGGENFGGLGGPVNWMHPGTHS